MNSLNSSYLQTSKIFTQPNPAERHASNKAKLQNFFTQLQNGISSQTKFRQLNSPQFKEIYAKPRYWYACKFMSNQENSSHSMIRVKVSNKQFCQITNDNKEIAFDLTSTWAVVIQPKSHYTYIAHTMELCQEIQREFEAQNNTYYKQEINNYRVRSQEYFGLFVPWHFQNATSRLCILVKDKLDKDKMLFVYNIESLICEEITQSMINSTFLDSKSESTINMKEIIKIHQCKQRYEKELVLFKSSFLKSVKNSFKDKVQTILQEEKRKVAGVLENKNLATAFRNFDLKQAQNLLVRWKNESAKLLKNKRLFIEVLSIWINKSKIPKSVTLNLKSLSREGKEEIQRKQYFYKTFDAQYGIYELQAQQKSRCLSFEIQKSTFSKQIFIEVEVIYQNGEVAKFKNTFLQFKLEGKDAFTHQLNLYLNNGENEARKSDCFIFLKTKESRVQTLNSIIEHHQRTVFDQVGQIPTKYRSSLIINYNPNTYGIVRELLLPHSPQKISKISYQQCYLALVHFIQQQENKSQLSVANTPPNSIVNKCPMKERLSFYEREVLKHITGANSISSQVYHSRLTGSGMNQQEKQIVTYIQSIDPRLFDELCNKEFVINQIYHKNLIEDLAHYQPLNQILVRQSLVKFIYVTSRVSQLKQFNYPLRYVSNLVPILEKYVAILFNSKTSNDQQNLTKQKYAVRFFVFMLIIAKIYPYCNSSYLKKDLLILRSLVLKYLPYYNDFLNRMHIGLQNVVSTHLLNLFTDLSEELTFRIWDFLIGSQNTTKARLVVVFTLLSYLQTTKNLPIIPINQFMSKVEQNYNKIVIPNQVGPKEVKALQTYFLNQQKKTKRLQKLIKDNTKSVADDKYLQRIILGDTLLKEEQQQKIRAQYEHNKVVQLIKDLSYPLPRPNYFGKPVTDLIFFVHNLNILQNLNLVAQKYSIRFSSPMAKQKQKCQLFIVSKNHFYNESFKLPLDPVKSQAIQREEDRILLVQVVQKNGDKFQRVQLVGKLNLSHYHKDKAYKTLIVLRPINKHNKGETILSISICLKSTSFNSKLQTKSFANLQQFTFPVFEYEIGYLNQSMHKLNDLNDELQRIKSPLDEFEANHNKRIQNSAINYVESSWLQNSKTSIEQLKTIFYHIFPNEKDKDLKLEFSKIYQIFSEQRNMQYVHLAQVLSKLILSTNITRKKKLTYLYCLGVHYQNSYSKKLTSQSVNSILRLILQQQQIISACPYEIETCGNILQAYFFGSSLKNPDQKTYFTQILQDWVYICTFKFSYSAIILGTSHNLSILKSLFDTSTLRRIESQPECRFQIVYEINGNKYLWSTTVQSKTFNILKRGTKFLNNFDGYSQLKYLDSTQEYLFNCQNIIPLQVHKGFSYSQFTKIMLQNELVKYALQIPPIHNNVQKYESVVLKDVLEDSRSSNFYTQQNADDKLNKRIVDQLQDDVFDSWVLHRSQNCLQNWKRCSIVSPGPILSEIKYSEDGEIYTVNTIDLISMDEIQIEEGK